MVDTTQIPDDWESSRKDDALEADTVKEANAVETPRHVHWHRHRYTAWGEITSMGGFANALSGGGPFTQTRTCVHCGIAQRHLVVPKERA